MTFPRFFACEIEQSLDGWGKLWKWNLDIGERGYRHAIAGRRGQTARHIITSFPLDEEENMGIFRYLVISMRLKCNSPHIMVFGRSDRSE